VRPDPGVSAWLADWRPLPSEAAAATGDTATREPTVDEDHSPTRTSGHAKRAGTWIDAGDDARKESVGDRAVAHGFALSAAAERLAFAPSAGDPAPKAIDKVGAMESAPASTPALPTLAALTTPGTSGAPGAATVVATVPTPFASPDFAAAFGLQVSLLARDGHQRAELHLNPAEMGPVSVQIVVDGTQARIDFGADVASTRQAIEAGLPELASALRDAGLTLHGGGVSSHAGSRGGERGERDGAGTGDHIPPADEAAQTRTQRIWRAAPGGVDLYA
jgi:flagellar hook-length control protein FliK